MKSSIPLRRQIKAAQTALAMEDDAYKSLLNRVTGKQSSTELNHKQIEAVLDEFRRLGWKPKSELRDKQIRLIQYLWMRLGEEGVLKNASKMAMFAYAEKFTKIRGKSVPLSRASSQALSNVIESLKDWCQRERVSTGNIK